MRFGLALELPNVDFLNIDLLNVDLLNIDLYPDIPSKYFACLHNVFKTSSRRLQRNNFSSSKTSSRRLGRHKIATLKTC